MDLSKAKEDITISLFEPEAWSKLVEKNKKLVLKAPSSNKSLKEKWDYIAESVISVSSLDTAIDYIHTLRSRVCTSKEKKQTLDFLSQILYFIDANKFILNPSNSSKVSERDFAYQIRLPLPLRISSYIQRPSPLLHSSQKRERVTIHLRLNIHFLKARDPKLKKLMLGLVVKMTMKQTNSALFYVTSVKDSSRKQNISTDYRQHRSNHN